MGKWPVLYRFLPCLDCRFLTYPPLRKEPRYHATHCFAPRARSAEVNLIKQPASTLTFLIIATPYAVFVKAFFKQFKWNSVFKVTAFNGKFLEVLKHSLLLSYSPFFFTSFDNSLKAAAAPCSTPRSPTSFLSSTTMLLNRCSSLMIAAKLLML